MAIQLQNKRSAEFSMASMSDMVFLLLIFFMITSTFVAPNAINLLLPKSSSGKQLVSRNIEVYIDAEKNYYVNPKGQNTPPVEYEELLPVLQAIAAEDQTETKMVIIRADKSVPFEYVVALLDVLNALNESLPADGKYRIVCATIAK